MADGQAGRQASTHTAHPPPPCSPPWQRTLNNVLMVMISSLRTMQIFYGVHPRHLHPPCRPPLHTLPPLPNAPTLYNAFASVLMVALSGLRAV